MRRFDGCAICGSENFQKAHVKDFAEFGPQENDKQNNLIPLCPNHHSLFDSGKIGICPQKNAFIMKSSEIKKIKPRCNLSHLREDYIEYKNDKCDPEIRMKMGLIDSASWGDNICER